MLENTKPLASYLKSSDTPATSSSTMEQDPHRQKREAKKTVQETATSTADAEQEMKQAIEQGKVHDVQKMFVAEQNYTQQEDHENLEKYDPRDMIQWEEPGKPRIDALLFAGGFGCMWDFPFHPAIDELARYVYEDRKGIIACIGHGSAALLNIHLSNGDLVVRGKECTSTSNEEEFNNHRLALYPKHPARGEDPISNKDKTVTMLTRLEDLLRNAQGIYKKGDMLTSFTVVDPPSLTEAKQQSEGSLGRLITGQNCHSAKEVADQILIALSHQPCKK
jgi:putative intracellular protease/amidase